MRQSTRLIINSASMFGRMAFTVGIGLLITRLLLNWLGKVDFGLLLALGATGTLLQFVTSSLSTSVQRQLAYEIGRADTERLSRVFSTAWVLFLALGVCLWLIGFALTPLVLHLLTIPTERLAAAWWVYQISLLTLVLAVTAAPYQALIIAHQNLTVNAVADAIVVVTRLIAVLLLLIVPWDRMVAFAAFQLVGYAVVRWLVNAYCLWRYDGSWPRPQSFSVTDVKQMAGVASWTLLGDLSWRLRMQGGVLLLNIFFGPAVNAAYGISVQVAGYIVNFAQALRLTVFPAIVGAHAKGNRQNVHRLALVAGKYAVLLLSLLFVPLLIDVDQALSIWLGEVPEYSSIFTRLVGVWALSITFFAGHVLALLAVGDIGWHTRYTLLISAASLIVSAIGFHYGVPPWFLPVVSLLSQFLWMAITVIGIGAQIDLAPRRWIEEALLPTLSVLVPATAVAMGLHWSLPQNLWRLAAVTAAYSVVAVPLIWWVGLAAWEREKFLAFANSAVARLQRVV